MLGVSLFKHYFAYHSEARGFVRRMSGANPALAFITIHPLPPDGGRAW